MLRVGKHTVILSSIGASPLFSGAERYFRTESESPWASCAASSGRRKEELVERNASVALKTAVTEIRVHVQQDRSVEFANYQRRKVVVSESGTRFPYRDRVSVGRRCGPQLEP